MNQLESGTSSMVLTFCARTSGVGSPGRPNRFMARSIDQIDLPFLHLRRILRLGLALQRVVVEESPTGT